MPRTAATWIACATRNPSRRCSSCVAGLSSAWVMGSPAHLGRASVPLRRSAEWREFSGEASDAQRPLLSRDRADRLVQHASDRPR